MMKLRIARPSVDLAKAEEFYCSILGMKKLGSFHGHDGFDGIMLGFEGHPYHIEFTIHHSNQIMPTPTVEDLLVFYIPDPQKWNEFLGRIQSEDITPVQSHNPYWDQKGITIVDPDGYRIVITNRQWN
ncbi:MAG: VOC family protein [Bdellovibrionales bacterium]|nr:VOC family protein [Bdellovibrionales bacterium]